ncbi:hypothetical protein [Kineosporia sp. R_H_3]|uniref:hypothetical protein n=1 Tax=Kineosporia sp. R_H_3 TaxID=1961848 RepID=UPI000B4B897C|nr:hypothetical protein [Kineosporia sp. R_H_3]
MNRSTMSRSTMSRARFLAAAAAGALAVALVPAGPAQAAPATAARHAALPDRIELPVGWQPEGITSAGSRFWSGSLAGGGLLAGDLRTGRTKVVLPGKPGLTIVGLYYAERSGLVWAAGADGATSTVWAIDGRTGAVKAAVPVALDPAGFLNDLVATRTDVWVTESFANRLVRIPLNRHGLPKGKVSVLPIPAPFPTTGQFKANGVRALSDGSLVLNHSGAGGLWRYDPKRAKVTEIMVKGTPATVSGDGLDLRGNTLYNVRGSGGQDVTVVELAKKHGRWSGTVQGVLSSTDVDVPTTGTLAKGSFWVVNARFGNPSPATASFWVTRLDLLDD